MRFASLSLLLGLGGLVQGVNYLDTTQANGRSTAHRVDSNEYFNSDLSWSACSFGDIPTDSFPFGNVASVAEENYAGAAGCGRCYELTCFETLSKCCKSLTDSVIIQVVDKCPRYDPDIAYNLCDLTSNKPFHFELNATLFDTLANWPPCDIINVNASRVSCDFGSANIVAVNGAAVTANNYSVVIRSVNDWGDIQKVLLRESGGGELDWIHGVRDTATNYWLFESRIGDPLNLTLPFDLIVSSNGFQIQSDAVITSLIGGAMFDLGNNFIVGGPAPQTQRPSAPTNNPIAAPTGAPSHPTDSPSVAPIDSTDSPSGAPSDVPSQSPIDTPTKGPSNAPSDVPSQTPSQVPSQSPIDTPTEPPIDPIPCLLNKVSCNPSDDQCCTGLACKPKGRKYKCG